MKSQSVVGTGRQTPTLKHAPQTRRNSWEDVADVAKAYGLVLDEWQENVLEAAMGERYDGHWSTPRVGVAVPRQNGKGALIEARELAGLLVFGEQTIVHSAHEQRTARIGFDRLKAYFDNYDDLRRKVKAIGSAVAREYIELRSGQFIRFPARSKGAIRGFSIDCLLLDEAQIFSDLALQAVMPTMAARPNPQMWLLGTPPTPADDGEVFTRWRQAGHAGSDRRLCWCEWSAPIGSDMDDRQVWATANPALGSRISFEAVADERAALDDDGFGRERLGMWSSSTSNRVIPQQFWDDVADPLSVPVDCFALGVEVAPDKAWASVSLAGRRGDGRWTIELDERRDSAAWVVPYVAALVEANPQIRAVVADAGSPSAALFDEFAQAKVAITSPRVSDLGSACTAVLEGVITGAVRHTAQPQMSAAVAIAGKRKLGDTGMWVWSRASAVSDITPIQAATLALWGAQNSTVKKPMRRRTSTRTAVVL